VPGNFVPLRQVFAAENKLAEKAGHFSNKNTIAAFSANWLPYAGRRAGARSIVRAEVDR
jgi:hypothetical protein